MYHTVLYFHDIPIQISEKQFDQFLNSLNEYDIQIIVNPHDDTGCVYHGFVRSDPHNVFLIAISYYESDLPF